MGFEGLISEANSCNSLELITSRDNLGKNKALLSSLPIVDVVILMLHFDDYSPVTLLSLLEKYAPDIHHVSWEIYPTR